MIVKQEANPKVGLGETPRRFNLKRCRYSSLVKFEDAFDTALYLMQTKSSDAAFSTVFITSINADRKQLVTSFPTFFLGPVVLDKCVQLRDHSLNHSREIPPEVVGGGIFDSFFSQ